jgi:predicted peptidase
MKFLLAAVGLLFLGTVAHAQLKPDMDKLLERHTFTKEKGTLLYRLMKPAGYDPSGKERYPLVIYLHGAAGRGTNNTSQLRSGVEEIVSYGQKHPCFVLVPQCPPDQMWVKISPLEARNNLPLTPKPTEPSALVLELIDALVLEHRIDKDRIYVTGYSMGGYGTWELISRRPDLFAAAMPLSGGGDPAQAEKLTKLSLWVFHGALDPLAPVARARDMIAALKKAGGEPKYTEYPGAGHDTWTRAYRDSEVLDWLFGQRRGR